MPNLFVTIVTLIFFVAVGTIGVWYGDMKISEANAITPVTPEVQSEIQVYSLAILLSKVMVIVSIGTIVFVLTDLCFLGGINWGYQSEYSSGSSSSSTQTQQSHPLIQQNRIRAAEEAQKQQDQIQLQKRRRRRQRGFEASPQHLYAKPHVDDVYSDIPSRFDAIFDDEEFYT
jgi:hypothetical protein